MLVLVLAAAVGCGAASLFLGEFAGYLRDGFRHGTDGN